MNSPEKTTKYAEMAWTADDVLSVAPKITREQAEAWLAQNEHHITDRLTELGWDIVTTLLQCDGIDTSDR